MPIQYTYHSNSTIQPKEINTFGERCSINTSARLYDPLLGRFLQPDNLVQQPEVLSNYNRYTYVLNNPLKYKDPSGEVFVIDDVLLGVIGGAINVASNWGNISNVWQGLGYFGIGFAGGVLAEYITPVGSAALVGASNAALGSYINTGKIDAGAVIQGAVIGGIVGGITYGINSSLSPVIDKALSGISSPVLRYAISGGVIGSISGGIGGGMGSVMNGGNFWQGAATGAVWGAGIGAATGAYQGYKYAKANNVDPWTGKSLHENPTYREISREIIKGQERVRMEGDYEQALQKWNEIVNQYENPEVTIGVTKEGYEYRGFETILSNGSSVKGSFYYGGGQNPTGWNIKIFIENPSTINKIPPMYIRFNKN